MGAFDDLVPAAPAAPTAQPGAPAWQPGQPYPGGINVTQRPDGSFVDAQGNVYQSNGVGPDGTQHALNPVKASAPAPSGGAFDDLVPTADAKAPGPGLDTDDGAVDATIRTLARGVPILGPLANYANAATNATLAPWFEPLLDAIPGHDRRDDIAEGGASWGQRFDRSLAMQRALDAQVDHDHPVLSLGGQIVGGALGVAASGGLLTPATGFLARVAPEAGLLPQMATGAVDGAALGGAQGYLAGDGGLGDPSRIQGAERGAIFGGAAGGAAAPVLAGGRALWNATGQKLVDAALGPVTIGDAPASDADLLAQAVGDHGADQLAGRSGGGNLPASGASPRTAADDLADAIAARAEAPSIEVAPSAASGAYDRIFRAISRAGQTPDEVIDQARKLGTFGTLADTSVPAMDLARAVADAPGQGGQIAQRALDLRQKGSLDPATGQWEVRPASLRVGDTLGNALGVSEGAADAQSALVARQRSAAGPAYRQAYAAPPVSVDDLSDFSSSPMFQEAYDRARAISQREFVTMPDGSEKIMPLPPLDLTAPAAPGAIGGSSLSSGDTAFDQALQDIRQYGPERSGSLITAIRAKGGLKLLDSQGQRYSVGPDIDGDVLAARYPGLINNRSGMPAEGMAQALQEDGWFGHGVEDPTEPFEQAMWKDVNGDGYFHPDAYEVGHVYNQRALDEEMSAAGIPAGTPTPKAAQMLADYRSADNLERQAIQAEGNAGDPYQQEFDRLSAPRGQQLDWRTLDLMKQGMDDMVREGRVQGIGANEQRATTGYLSRFVDQIDALNPDYATARAAFAGPAKLLDAIDAGRAYMGEDAPTVTAAMKDLSPSEQDAYRLGAVQAERDRLGSVPVTYDAATRAGVNTPNRLAKLQALFPDQASYAAYVQKLQNEATMFGTRARVLGNSSTASRLAHMDDMESNPLEALSEVAEMGHNPHGGALRLLGRLLTAGNGQQLREPVANAASAIMFNQNPDAFPSFEQGLSDAATRARLAAIVAGKAQPAASTAASGLATALDQYQR
jgi:hypothetical protein